MWRGFALWLIATALCGCAVQGKSISTSSTERLTSIELTPEQRAAIESGIRPQLKDPESARFGRMVAGVDRKGGITVCGYVNARNSYGGYTGEQPFSGLLETKPQLVFLPAAVGGSDFERRVTFNVCESYGLRI